MRPRGNLYSLVHAVLERQVSLRGYAPLSRLSIPGCPQWSAIRDCNLCGGCQARGLPCIFNTCKLAEGPHAAAPIRDSCAASQEPGHTSPARRHISALSKMGRQNDDGQEIPPSWRKRIVRRYYLRNFSISAQFERARDEAITANSIPMLDIACSWVIDSFLFRPA